MLVGNILRLELRNLSLQQTKVGTDTFSRVNSLSLSGTLQSQVNH